jgi:ornithine decarboxylase
MFVGPLLTHGVATGVLAGKLLADLFFYAIVIPAHEISRSRANSWRTSMDEQPDDLTPIVVMDLAKVADAYREMDGALPEIAIHYAVKCNPHPAVLARLHGLGCGFEVASASEVDLLGTLGIPAGGLLYSNPVKPVAHIARAYRAGVRRYAFDSQAELAKLADAAPGSSVYVRLATAAARSDVPSEGKFGVDPERAVELMLAARSLGLHPYGIAFHVGSQMLSPMAWLPAVEAVGEVMEKLATDGIVIDMVNLGGGLPARYSVEPPAVSEYGSVMRAGLAGLPYPVHAVIEPGRALVAAAGTMVSTVIGIAERGGKHWVHLDVGAFNGFMESLETGNRLRFPMRDSKADPERRMYHVTGPTCDSQDTILFDVEMSADLAVGDRVFIEAAGAYTTVYATTFNGFDAPGVWCVQ